MKFGFSLVVRGKDATPEAFTQIAERAEALEIDSLWCSSHIILPPQIKSGYAMVPGVQHPEHWKERYWEPFSVLSYLSAKTTRLRLGTSIVVLPMHNPFEIAKQAAEVDQLSSGRFTFGLGVGWFEEEFEVLNQDFHSRGARTNEALALIKTLWTEDPVTFQGRYYQVENAYFGPKPVQQPGPPIWVAGNSKAAMKRAARYADAWHPVRPTLEFLVEAKADLNRYLEEESRNPESLALALKLPLVVENEASGTKLSTRGRPADIAAAIEGYRELGASHFVFDLVPEELATTLDTMEQFAQEIRPRLS